MALVKVLVANLFAGANFQKLEVGKVYEVDDNFVLIDTPGLFGFKEQFNADINAMEKYKDITRKYVSEAHLVLYVMNSTNPIKDSHKDAAHRFRVEPFRRSGRRGG